MPKPSIIPMQQTWLRLPWLKVYNLGPVDSEKRSSSHSLDLGHFHLHGIGFQQTATGLNTSFCPSNGNFMDTRARHGKDYPHPILAEVIVMAIRNHCEELFLQHLAGRCLRSGSTWTPEEWHGQDLAIPIDYILVDQFQVSRDTRAVYANVELGGHIRLPRVPIFTGKKFSFEYDVRLEDTTMGSMGAIPSLIRKMWRDMPRFKRAVVQLSRINKRIDPKVFFALARPEVHFAKGEFTPPPLHFYDGSRYHIIKVSSFNRSAA